MRTMVVSFWVICNFLDDSVALHSQRVMDLAEMLLNEYKTQIDTSVYKTFKQINLLYFAWFSSGDNKNVTCHWIEIIFGQVKFEMTCWTSFRYGYCRALQMALLTWLWYCTQVSQYLPLFLPSCPEKNLKQYNFYNLKKKNVASNSMEE